MRLTVEQRLRALERDNVVLHDTIKLLHKMLKEQRMVISDYITLKMAKSNGDNGHKGGNGRPCEEIYSFVCKGRLDRADRDVQKMRKSIEALKYGPRAG
jgi:uncharacterized coiled-coil protein SlyX